MTPETRAYYHDLTADEFGILTARSLGSIGQPGRKRAVFGRCKSRISNTESLLVESAYLFVS